MIETVRALRPRAPSSVEADARAMDLGSAIGYLQMTVEGRQWIANLYCNVFEIEHTRRSMGPDSGAPSPESPVQQSAPKPSRLCSRTPRSRRCSPTLPKRERAPLQSKPGTHIASCHAWLLSAPRGAFYCQSDHGPASRRREASALSKPGRRRRARRFWPRPRQSARAPCSFANRPSSGTSCSSPRPP